jgi:hypothetical protein
MTTQLFKPKIVGKGANRGPSERAIQIRAQAIAETEAQLGYHYQQIENLIRVLRQLKGRR